MGIYNDDKRNKDVADERQWNIESIDSEITQLGYDDRNYGKSSYSYSGLIWRIVAGFAIGAGLLSVGLGATSYLFDPVKRMGAIEGRPTLTVNVANGDIKERSNVYNEMELKMLREKARIEIDKERKLEAIRLARRTEEAEKAKKEAAFKAFYRKPEQCYSPYKENIMVECANKYIRARREFEMAHQ